jgi:hypothetical protein
MRQELFLVSLFVMLIISQLQADINIRMDIPEPDLISFRSDSRIAFLQEPGKVMIPYLPLRVLIPQGEKFTGIEIEIDDSGRVIREVNFPVYSRQTSISGKIANDNPDPKEDLSLAVSYPDLRYRVFGHQRKMGYDILIINLYPYQYDAGERSLSIADSYQVKIETEYDREFALEQNRRLLTQEAARNEIRRLVDNPETVESYYKMRFNTGNEFSNSLPDESEPFTMIVITDQIRAPFFSDYIDWKNNNGLSTSLFLLEDIYLHYPGIDNQEKIRNFIIDAYETYSLTDTPLEYVLLGGDDSILPVRGFYCFVSGLWTDYEDYHIPSDVYYSNLDGDWDANGNGIYGEVDDGIDWFAEIAVGRIPAVTEQDFHNFFDKNIHYTENISYSNDIAVMIGQNLDSITWGGDYKNEIIPLLPDKYKVTTFYEKDGTYNALAIREAINRGVGILNHLGHSNENTVFGMTSTNVNQLSNNSFGLAYSQGCYTAAFDNSTTQDSEAIGQRFVNSSKGFFAFIGNTRYGWYWPGSTEGASQLFDITFFEGLFEQDIRNIGKTLNYSKETLVNEAIANDFEHHLWKNGFMRWTFYNQILFGDPSTWLLGANGLFPYLEPVNVIYDDQLGDKDGIVNPGESVDIYIELLNHQNWSDACSIHVSFAFDNPDIEVKAAEASYPSIAAGSQAANLTPFIITLPYDIPYGEYQYSALVTAKGSQTHEFRKEFQLSVPISLRQKHWPWESSVPIQGVPLIVQDTFPETLIIAIDALSQVSFLDFRGESSQSPISFSGSMLRSAAMGDLRGNGVRAVVFNNRNGLISAFDPYGQELFNYETGSQFIMSPLLADITGNGELEIISYSTDKQLFVLSAAGEPLTGFPLQLEHNILIELAAADIDNDHSAEIICGFVNGRLDAIKQNGSSSEGFPIELGSPINLSPIVLDNSNIVTATQDNRLVLLSPTGAILWEKALPSRPISEAVAADFTKDGNLEIAFAASNGNVYLIDQAGNDLNGFPILLGEVISQPPLAVDIDNSGELNLLISTMNGLIYGFNADGSETDMLPAPLNLPPASSLFIADIDSDGDFEIGYGTNLGISILDYKLPAGREIPWSEYRGNQQRTGYFNDNILINEDYEPPEPLVTELRQNFPNPFNTSTTIPFSLDTATSLKIRIYNIKGQFVTELYDGAVEHGEGEVYWNGRDNRGKKVASGIYFTKMVTDSITQVRKMLLLK